MLANFNNQHNVNQYHNYISHNHNYASSAVSIANTIPELRLHYCCFDPVHVGYHSDNCTFFLAEEKRKTTSSGI
jgi:hypothetical protein